MMRGLDALTKGLVIIGGLNWGLVAIANFDLVATIFGMQFGEANALSRIVYGLVGLSAIYQAATFRRSPATVHQMDDARYNRAA